MTEAITWQMPNLPRSLFSTLLVYGACSNPLKIWTTFKEHMMEDFMHEAEQLPGVVLPLQPHICQELEYRTLRHIEDLPMVQKKTLKNFNLPQPPDAPRQSIVLVEKAKYNVDALRKFVQNNQSKLNTEQRQVFTEVLDGVRQPSLPGSCKDFFNDSPGGFGKTFTISLLLAAVR